MSSPFELQFQNAFVPADTTEFPPVTAIRTNYLGLSSTEVFPKYAMIVKIDGTAGPGGSSVETTPSNSTSWGGLSVQTQATGTNYSTFPSVAATTCDVLNTTGTDLYIKSTSITTPFILPSGAAVQIFVTANTNEIQVRRVDGSNTQVTLHAQHHKF